MRNELGAGDVVIIAARWGVQLGAQPFSLLDAEQFLGSTDWRVPSDIVETQITSAVRSLVDRGVGVLVVRPVPELRRPAPQCLASPIFADDCDETLADHVAFADTANRFLSRLGRMRGVRVIDPIPRMCHDMTCPVQEAGIVRYIDDDHLSATFSRSMAPLFEAPLDRLLTGPERDVVPLSHPMVWPSRSRDRG